MIASIPSAKSPALLFARAAVLAAAVVAVYANSFAGVFVFDDNVASKEVGLMAIPVGWLYDWSYFRAIDGVAHPPLTWHRKWLAVIATCGLLAAGSWLIKPVLLEDGSAGFGTIAVTPGQYLRSQPGVIAHYHRLVAWPNPLRKCGATCL